MRINKDYPLQNRVVEIRDFRLELSSDEAKKVINKWYRRIGKFCGHKKTDVDFIVRNFTAFGYYGTVYEVFFHVKEVIDGDEFFTLDTDTITLYRYRPPGYPPFDVSRGKK